MNYDQFLMTKKNFSPVFQLLLFLPPHMHHLPCRAGSGCDDRRCRRAPPPPMTRLLFRPRLGPPPPTHREGAPPRNPQTYSRPMRSRPTPSRPIRTSGVGASEARAAKTRLRSCVHAVRRGVSWEIASGVWLSKR